jgi:hypothetical protein
VAMRNTATQNDALVSKSTMSLIERAPDTA